MVSGSLALLHFLLGFHGGRQGSGLNRGQSPVEWGDFLFVRPFVCSSIRPPPLAGLQAWLAGPQTLLAGPQTWLTGPQTWLAGPQAWRAGPQTWLALPQAWLAGSEGG